ncbi:hypothetical protein LR48_Vigan07g191200 [Vigna angularis]|uniref:Uncharacterized protein n=1 Tax=Phaseolus angularis TaxID=3914 RepID=A0A0L9UZJ6_PHAAN|nr:hypothetical protein LR48_Vigan07g191200 [Vigna angularis]
MCANEWIDQGSMCEMLVMTLRVRDQGSMIEVQGSGIEDRGSRTYKLKLPLTSQSPCTSAPNAFVFQSTCTPAPIESPIAFFQSSVQVNSNGDALHSPSQVRENSHLQDEHEQDENQDTLLEVEQQRPPTHKGAWSVDVIDDQSKMTTKHLKLNDVWNLPQNERIIVRWNDECQPIGDAGALFNRFLGSIARNFKAFPICYSTWKKIPKTYKEDIIQNTIQEKIEAYESTISSTQSKEISSSDSLAPALGIKEHCGRVRGLGLGPCPSKVFGVHARSHGGSSSTSVSNVELQTQVSDQGSVPNDGCNEKGEP